MKYFKCLIFLIVFLPVICFAQEIRVGLNYSDLAEYTISSEGFILLSESLDGEKEEFKPSLTFKHGDNGNFIINDIPFDFAKCYLFPPEGKYLSYNGVQFRGYLELVAQNRVVINVVDQEEYLWSVVGWEMSPAWHVEALKAQAMAARTYVHKNMNRHQSGGYNVCSDVHCQAYGGIVREAPSTVQAVNETAGLILTYEGQPIDSVYFSSSGGVTETAKYVWGSDVPYLVSVSDEHELDEHIEQWTHKFTKAEIRQIATKKNNGVDIGEVISMEITQRTPAGRALELTIRGTAGEVTATKEGTRTFFGTSSVRSSFYDISGGSTGDKPYAFGGDKLSGTTYAIGADDNVYPIGEQMYVVDADDSVKLYESSSDGDFVITGKGWGHAVGMSQWGAKALAEKGYSAQEIVKYYYTGIEIQ